MRIKQYLLSSTELSRKKNIYCHDARCRCMPWSCARNRVGSFKPPIDIVKIWAPYWWNRGVQSWSLSNTSDNRHKNNSCISQRRVPDIATRIVHEPELWVNEQWLGLGSLGMYIKVQLDFKSSDSIWIGALARAGNTGHDLWLKCYTKLGLECSLYPSWSSMFLDNLFVLMILKKSSYKF